MKKFIILLSTMLLYTAIVYSQVAINTDGTDPNSSAMLDVKSSDKGFLPPRVATVDNISSPVAGLMVFDENTNCMRYYNGTVWSECMGKTFTCGDALIDARDGQSYNTVQIGTQCWMAENLNIGTMINGSSNQTNNSVNEKYCFNDNLANCDTYGGLYQWDEAMQYVTTAGTRGICPSGWHLPTDVEWMTMEEYLGMCSGTYYECSDSIGWRGTDEGGKLKETGTTHWASPNTGATNSSGFTGLPGGYRDTNGSFYNLTYYANFWSSLENGSGAWYRRLGYNKSQVYRSHYSKAYGCSVRCLRD